jgi:circadian clock protein KaiB
MSISAAGPQQQPLPVELFYRLTLYISGGSELSRHAVSGAKAFCDAALPGRYGLSVLDLETHASSATADGVLATPTLIMTEPSPPRRYVGDLSRIDRVAQALGLTLEAPASERSGG